MKTVKSWLGISTTLLVSICCFLEFAISLSSFPSSIQQACCDSPQVHPCRPCASCTIQDITKWKIVRFLFFFKKVNPLIHGLSSKAPTQTQKFKTLQKLILSFFSNITHIISQLTDEDTLRLAIAESAKLVPYIISSRKAVKSYLKVCTFAVF